MASGGTDKRQLIWISIIGGLAIVASGVLLLRQVGRYAVNHSPSQVGTSAPVALPKRPPNPSTLKYTASSTFSGIQSVDRDYQDAAARWIGFKFRGVETKGPDAGLISLIGVRLASGIVPLPPTLAAAHVTVGPSTPADQSMQGVGPAVLSKLQHGSGSSQVGRNQVQSLLRTALSAGLSVDSNNPLQFLSQLDGPAPAGSENLAQSAVAPNGSLIQHIIGATHGDLPNARYFYRVWAQVNPAVKIQWINPTPIAHQTVVAEVRLTAPVQIGAVGTVNHGGAIAAVTQTPFDSLTLDLLKSQGKMQWYVVQYSLNLSTPTVGQIYRNNLNANGF